MSESSYENVELPGVGEIRARAGTSTIELAGAAKHWYDKCQTARIDGFIAGAGIVFLLDILCVGMYFLLR